MDGQFFDKLVEFLPKHVSPMPSYVHGAVAFTVMFVVVYLLGGEYLVLDFDQDGEISETEQRAQDGVRLAVAVIIALLVADLVFSISWKRRNFSINKNHVTYKRWFPKAY
jgi:hypothetical protein